MSMNDTRCPNNGRWFGDCKCSICVLERELSTYKASAPLCTDHLSSGTRSGCLVCAMQRLTAALSAIDYALGEPNEQGLSGYDTHYDEERVVQSVARLKSDLEAARKGENK
jgi:uncharacterized protein (DUF1501 family)